MASVSSLAVYFYHIVSCIALYIDFLPKTLYRVSNSSRKEAIDIMYRFWERSYSFKLFYNLFKKFLNTFILAQIAYILFVCF